MDFEVIERLMKMLEASELNDLDVAENGMRIRLAKKKANGEATAVRSELPFVHYPDNEVPEATFRRIRAGMAGTFYRAPAPGAEPFVEVGSSVREGEQLGIVEAMKMLNPVEAECDGVIIAINITDGSSVEPGTALFDIEPS